MFLDNTKSHPVTTPILFAVSDLDFTCSLDDKDPMHRVQMDKHYCIKEALIEQLTEANALCRYAILLFPFCLGPKTCFVYHDPIASALGRLGFSGGIFVYVPHNCQSCGSDLHRRWGGDRPITGEPNFGFRF